MISTIDAAGRIVVPKRVREQAKLLPGTPLEIRCRDGVIEIEPAPIVVRLRRRGRLTVAVPEQPVQQLSAAAVEETRTRLRRERSVE
jgi:AbrB family looped-hinge helix DNA binding protein